MISLVSQVICLSYLLKGQDPCEYEKIHEAEYRQEVTEMFVDHIKDKKNFVYGWGCYGQKGCKGKYDCSGLIYSFAYENGLNISKQNSTSAYKKFGSKKLEEAEYGDLVYFEKLSGDRPNHLAIVYGEYENGKLEIVDSLYSKVENRIISINSQRKYVTPNATYKIHIVNNGYIEQYLKENPQESMTEIVQGIVGDSNI